LACGTRWGKTTCAAVEAVAALLEPRAQALGWIVGPTYELTDRIFKKVLALLNEHFEQQVAFYTPREHRIVVLNMSGGRSELRARSADRPESLLGEAIDFLIIDEAASVRDNVWDQYLAPRLLDRNGWALLVSTPHGRGWFYREFRRGQKNRDADYQSWQAPTTHNPHIDPAMIEAERARLDADTFAEQYCAQFVGPPEPCDVCGGPSPDAFGSLVVMNDDEPAACSECAGPVLPDGKTAVALFNGKPYFSLMRIHTQRLTDKEIGNLRDWNPPELPE
jgi:hypothetical protein